MISNYRVYPDSNVCSLCCSPLNKQRTKWILLSSVVLNRSKDESGSCLMQLRRCIKENKPLWAVVVLTDALLLPLLYQDQHCANMPCCYTVHRPGSEIYFMVSPQLLPKAVDFFSTTSLESQKPL